VSAVVFDLDSIDMWSSLGDIESRAPRLHSPQNFRKRQFRNMSEGVNSSAFHELDVSVLGQRASRLMNN
jgi:hypothetical protein